MATTEKKMEGEGAQYEVSEPCYLNETLHKEGDQVMYSGIPSHYMKPLNDIAKAMVKKYVKDYIDPIEAMTLVGGA